MKIHEVTVGDRVVPILLTERDGTFFLGEDPLPDGAVEAAMKRLGKPLDASAVLTEVDSMPVGGARLRHVRHLARYDVIARDFLVYDASGEEPLVALATTVAGALDYLVAVTRNRR